MEPDEIIAMKSGLPIEGLRLAESAHWARVARRICAQLSRLGQADQGHVTRLGMKPSGLAALLSPDKVAAEALALQVLLHDGAYAAETAARARAQVLLDAGGALLGHTN